MCSPCIQQMATLQKEFADELSVSDGSRVQSLEQPRKHTQQSYAVVKTVNR